MSFTGDKGKAGDLHKGFGRRDSRMPELAMTDKDWVRYTDEHGHTPNWKPHEPGARPSGKSKE